MRTLANQILRVTGVAFLFFLLTSAVFPVPSLGPEIGCMGGWFSVGRSEPIESVDQLSGDLVLKAYAESLHEFFQQHDICSFDEVALEAHLRGRFGNVSISLETDPCTYKYMHDMFGNLVQACVPTQELIINTGAVGGAVHAWIYTIQEV